MSEPVLRVEGITKVFPGVKANDEISFSVRKGEILALLGENGAGKTTLMNILYGLYQPDAGEIYRDGRKVEIQTSNDALDLGIGMIHQHFMLVPPFSVIENIIMGLPAGKYGLLPIQAARREVQELSRKYGLPVDVDARVWQLPVGDQQRVEIVKALYRGADILILDEPTAVLTPQETDDLFAVLRTLKEQGKSVIFISHKLDEVKAISDRVTVLRNGRVVGTVETADTQECDLVRMMVGRDIACCYTRAADTGQPAVLELDGVTALNDKNQESLRGITFGVSRGEILGIAGVDGNGQTELAEVITGLRDVTGGTIRYLGEDIANLAPRAVMEKGISHIPADRRKYGLVMEFTVAENSVLQTYYQAPFSRGPNLRRDVIREHARRLIREYDVRTPGPGTPARSLSGGNQQKLIVAREFDRKPHCLVAVQPTRGVDVGAIEFIHTQLLAQRDAGTAILLISSDLEEVLRLCDRLAVVYGGRIMGIVDPDETPIEVIGRMMTGSLLADAGCDVV